MPRFDWRLKIALWSNPEYLRLKAKYIWLSAKGIYYVFFIYLTINAMRLLVRILKPNKQPIDLFIVSALVLSAGIYFSFVMNDWENFSRSGSIIVVISIAIHVWDVKTRSEKAKSEIVEYMSSEASKLEKYQEDKSDDARFSGDHLFREIQSLKLDMEACANRFRALDVEEVEKSYKKYEVVTGIFGTLIWGFGDLIGRLI